MPRAQRPRRVCKPPHKPGLGSEARSAPCEGVENVVKARPGERARVFAHGASGPRERAAPHLGVHGAGSAGRSGRRGLEVMHIIVSEEITPHLPSGVQQPGRFTEVPWTVAS
jgi:hypothetical protein